MKKTIIALMLAGVSATAAADSSYVTGNVQFHDSDLHGADVTSTVEIGHTFDNSFGGFTILAEIDGVQMAGIADKDVMSYKPVGKDRSFGVGEDQTVWAKYDTGLNTADKRKPYLTIGLEQSFEITDNLYAAVGYHHLSQDGETVQHRPLVKLGYNFDSGLFISNRTRAQISLDSRETIYVEEVGLVQRDIDSKTEVRLDNAIGYNFNSVQVKYNNVYLTDAELMDHEVRVTYIGADVQPYIEYRNQADDANNAIVVGASYGF
ncbi:porin [Vibrio owensii]|uniref:porin n=1 Tax=Vibrio owensii TaxID=696485 RepID=UPI003393E2DB